MKMYGMFYLRFSAVQGYKITFFMTLKYDFQLVGPMKNAIPLRTDIESAISAILGFRRDTNIKRLSFEFLH